MLNIDTTDEVDIKTVDRERFLELAVQWENETVLLSSSDQATKHPAYREIVDMGQLAIPLILERMQSHNGHWIQALHDTTGADPVRCFRLRQHRHYGGSLVRVGQSQWICVNGSTFLEGVSKGCL